MKNKYLFVIIILLLFCFSIIPLYAYLNSSKTATWSSTDWPAGTSGNKVIDTASHMSQYPQNTAADWNAGTFIEIDTTTTPGSFSLPITVGDRALGVSPTVSGTTFGSPQEATDGNDSTYWQDEGGVGESVWIYVDLSTPTWINRYNILAYAVGAPPYIQYSTDTITWTTIDTLPALSDWPPTTFISKYIPCTKARYWRVYNPYATPTAYLHVRTLNLYGGYASTGTYISQLLDYGYATECFGNLVASQTIPSGCDIQYQTRSSADNISWSVWSSTFTNGEAILSTPDRYLQWKALLYPNTTFTETPRIHKVYVGGSWRSAVKDLSSKPVSFGNITANYANDSIEYWLRGGDSISSCEATTFVKQTTGTAVSISPTRYIQLETRFNISTNTVNSPPSLTSVSIDYTGSSAPEEIKNTGVQDQTTVSNAEVKLEWSSSDPEGGQLTYKLYLGKDSNSMSLIYTGTNPYYTLSTLDKNTNYYWQVEALDIYGASTMSAIYNFKTVGEVAKAYNYPNPFNPASGQTTGIVFDMVESGTAELSIYSEFGDLCWKKSFIGLNKGVNQIDYNGRDDEGNFLYNGTYICRIKKKYANGEHNDKCRLLIIK